MNNLPFEFGLNFIRLLSLFEPDGGDDAPETIELDPSEYSVTSEDGCDDALPPACDE